MAGFMKLKKSNYVVIIGCGRLGATIANTLSDRDMDVLVIDKYKDSFRKLSPSFGGMTVVDDASFINVLKEIQIQKAKVVIVVTDNDNMNIMLAQIAKNIFGIKKVITRLYDYDRGLVYKELGIDTICPSVLSIQETEKLLNSIDGVEDKKEVENSDLIKR